MEDLEKAVESERHASCDKVVDWLELGALQRNYVNAIVAMTMNGLSSFYVSGLVYDTNETYMQKQVQLPPWLVVV